MVRYALTTEKAIELGSDSAIKQFLRSKGFRFVSLLDNNNLELKPPYKWESSLMARCTYIEQGTH